MWLNVFVCFENLSHSLFRNSYFCLTVFLYLLLIFFSTQDSVSDVEELLKKHRDFEKMLAAQEEKFVQLNRKTKVRGKTTDGLVNEAGVCHGVRWTF